MNIMRYDLTKINFIVRGWIFDIRCLGEKYNFLLGFYAGYQ